MNMEDHPIYEDREYHTNTFSVYFLQDLEKRWSQYVSDHEGYDVAYQDCAAWLNDVQQRLEGCLTTEGDKFTIQRNMEKLQVIYHEQIFLCNNRCSKHGFILLH